jgi:hypothetical protein
VGQIDAEGLAQARRSTSEVAPRGPVPAPFRQLDTVDHLARPQSTAAGSPSVPTTTFAQWCMP